jgi:hypothetical protein
VEEYQKTKAELKAYMRENFENTRVIIYFFK